MTGIASLVERTAQKERAAIVAWLRKLSAERDGWGATPSESMLAEWIEQGKHMEGTTNG